jgi:hypothetical protein
MFTVMSNPSSARVCPNFFTNPVMEIAAVRADPDKVAVAGAEMVGMVSSQNVRFHDIAHGVVTDRVERPGRQVQQSAVSREHAGAESTVDGGQALRVRNADGLGVPRPAVSRARVRRSPAAGEIVFGLGVEMWLFAFAAVPGKADQRKRDIDAGPKPLLRRCAGSLNNDVKLSF